MISFIRSRKFIVFLAVIALVGGLIIWRQKANAPTYESYEVKRETLTKTLDLSGKIEANSSATLRFLGGGYVTYIGAKEGNQVQKWQTIAALDARQLQKSLEQKLNLYAIQRGTYDQFVDDNDNSIPDGELGRELSRLLAKNQYQLENTVKDVEYQDLALRLSRLTSPIAGILVHAPTEVSGVQVSATDSWLVVDPKTLVFVADLDETDLSMISVGQKAVITLDAYQDTPLESSVTKISYAPKETTTGTTYEVTIPVPEGYLDRFRLGLNGTVSIALETKDNVLTLPYEAITLDSTGPMVYLKDGAKYKTTKLTLGIEDKGKQEIVQGLELGQVVYVKKSK